MVGFMCMRTNPCKFATVLLFLPLIWEAADSTNLHSEEGLFYASTSLEGILARARDNDIKDWTLDIRRKLHANPELMFEEKETNALICEKLDELGIRYDSPVGGTGVVATLGKREGRSVALRADMDALPLDELADVSFRSKAPGKMHACGHDAHVAMLLGAARAFLRGIMGVRTSTPSAALVGEFGRWLLLLTRWRQCISFYNRLCDLQEGARIVKLALLEAKEENSRGSLSWFTFFRRGISGLTNGRFGDQVDDLVKVDTTFFMDIAKDKYLSAFRAASGSKLRLYAEIKVGYEKEDYLHRLSFTPCLQLLGKFRCGSHDLEVEKGRHRVPFVAREERLCVHCSMEKVEDEAHFVFECPLYYEIRGGYHFLFRHAERRLCRFLNHPEKDVVGHFLLICLRLRGEQ